MISIIVTLFLSTFALNEALPSAFSQLFGCLCISAILLRRIVVACTTTGGNLVRLSFEDPIKDSREDSGETMVKLSFNADGNTPKYSFKHSAFECPSKTPVKLFFNANGPVRENIE